MGSFHSWYLWQLSLETSFFVVFFQNNAKYMASEKPEQTTNLWKIVDSFLARCSEWALDLVQTKLVMLLGGFTVSICSLVCLLFYKRQGTTRARMSPITRMGFKISASFLSMTILFSLVFFFFFWTFVVFPVSLLYEFESCVGLYLLFFTWIESRWSRS